jgi:hypothetical protein
MRARLTKMKLNKERRELCHLVGHSDRLPQLGQAFTIFTHAPEKQIDQLFIETSKVNHIRWLSNHLIEFDTTNSTYRLLVLE